MAWCLSWDVSGGKIAFGSANANENEKQNVEKRSELCSSDAQKEFNGNWKIVWPPSYLQEM